LEVEHYAENQWIARMLDARGFGIEGDEPVGVWINRFLRLKKLEE
jgi:hypothetical protein